MVRFDKTTTKAIRKWLKANGFNVSCRVGKYDLSYAPDLNSICVPYEYDDSLDTYFMKWLRKKGLKCDFDCMTLSLLHEVGHYMTENLFTEEEWDSDNMVKEALSMGTMKEKDFIFAYWNCPTEYMANMWLISYANTFADKCQELEDIIVANSYLE